MRAILRPSSATASSSASTSSGSVDPSKNASSQKPATRKLISEAIEYQEMEASKLLSETSDFTVIGVLGAQGVGKSTIMSLLAGASWGETAGTTDGDGDE